MPKVDDPLKPDCERCEELEKERDDFERERDEALAELAEQETDGTA